MGWVALRFLFMNKIYMGANWVVFCRKHWENGECLEIFDELILPSYNDSLNLLDTCLSSRYVTCLCGGCFTHKYYINDLLSKWYQSKSCIPLKSSSLTWQLLLDGQKRYSCLQVNCDHAIALTESTKCSHKLYNKLRSFDHRLNEVQNDLKSQLRDQQ